jgi:hypothetical protein
VLEVNKNYGGSHHHRNMAAMLQSHYKMYDWASAQASLPGLKQALVELLRRIDGAEAVCAEAMGVDLPPRGAGKQVAAL